MVGSVGGWEGKEWMVGSVRGCIELLYTYKQIYHSCKCCEYNSFTYIIGTCICVHSRRVGGQKMMTG